MKFSPGIGVGAMSGSQGGTTASRGRAGQYFRTRTMPTQPNTAKQTSVRTNLATASNAWGATLTDSQRTAWNDFATAFPITDRLGQTLQLTGQQAFVRLNSRLLNAGEAQITTAPTDQDVTDVTTITATVTVTGTVMSLAFTPSPLAATDLLIVRATPAFSPGKSYFTNALRDILVTTAAASTPLDVAAAWATAFGAFPAAGTKVGFSVNCIRNTNGAYDAELRATAVVGA